MKLLFLLLIFVVFGVAMFLFSIIRGVGQLIFGRPNSSTNNSGSRQTNYNNNSTQHTQSVQKKIFGKDEGEYVKYEEVKD